ncbi:MAG: TIGR03545 family protein [Planctomycetota bacterium]
MRWTYLVPRLLILAVVWSFFAFVMDPLLRYSAAESLQSLTGARVDIGSVRTKFFPPTMTIRNVALARAGRPGKNMVEFDEMHLSLEPSSLSRRRFVVEEGLLTGVRFNTDRADDGQLEMADQPADEQPSWVSQKLTELGDDWLKNLTEQVRKELDPDTLETYRVGREVYGKWDARFEDMTTRAKEFEPRVRQLRIRFEDARKGDTLDQIEQYLLVSQDAEKLIREAQDFQNELKEIVPEVREDFKSLNESRERDQERIRHKLSLLKPDGRRITQALLGKPMYRQLQQILTWIEAARDYQSELGQQVRPPRNAGRDFEFAIRNPAPDFLLKRLTLTGQMSIQGEHVPFSATLSDVTEDPKLLQRPCLMELIAEGSRPLNLRVTYDATADSPVAEMVARYADRNPIPLLAGKPRETCLTGTLSDLCWQSRLRLQDSRIEGQIDLDSEISNLKFEATEDVRTEIVDAANDAMTSLSRLNATVMISGTLRDPEIHLESDVGEQISEGVKHAFTQQLNLAKERLVAEVNRFAGDQIEKLTGRFRGEYDQLLAENKDVLDQIGEVRAIVATLQSGRVDSQTLIRQVTNSRLIPEKDQEKIRRIVGSVEQTLNGHVLPESLQKRIQGLPAAIPNFQSDRSQVLSLFPQFQQENPRLSDELQQLPVLVPQLPGSFRSLFPQSAFPKSAVAPRSMTSDRVKELHP